MSFLTLCDTGFDRQADSSHVYLDHNATTPLAADVMSGVQEWLWAWGNPSSIHWAGRKPKLFMREARTHVARMLNCEPLELVFTSGGSEANNLALKGVFDWLQRRPPAMPGGATRDHYLISEVEHPSVRRTAEYLQGRGARVDFIPVHRDGHIDLRAFRDLLSDSTALVSVMYANNETGNLFPIREMTALAHEKGALFHTDAVQALGKIPLDVRALGVDLATISGHKFYALKGVGALYIHRGVQVESLIHGGGQERHRRGGTENLLAIASLGFMARRADQVIARAETMRALRDEFEARVRAEIPGVSVTGGKAERLPNTSSLVITGVDGETLLMNLDLRGYAVSTGAACSSGSPEPSPTLLAMGLSRQEAQSSLRIGLGWGTTHAQVMGFVDVLKDVVAHLRGLSASVGIENKNEVNHVRL